MVRTLSARKPEGAQPVWSSLPPHTRTMVGAEHPRLAIETDAVRRAADTANLEDLTDLRSLVDGMRSAPNVTSFVELDTAFHTRLVRIAGDDVATVLLVAMLEARRGRFEAVFDALEDAVDTRRALTQQLAAAVDAIKEHDGDTAVEMITRHVDVVDDVVGATHGALAMPDRP